MSFGTRFGPKIGTTFSAFFITNPDLIGTRYAQKVGVHICILSKRDLVPIFIPIFGAFFVAKNFY